MNRLFSAVLYATLGLSVLAGVTLVSATANSQPSSKRTKQILFVCTGNYYRSRFAEVLFNEKARESKAPWKAISRGLALVSSQHGISKIALRELQRRGVPAELCQGAPQALTRADLAKSDYIVFMDEKEHRVMFEKKFPKITDPKIHYWHIPDGSGNCVQACQLMSDQIDELVHELN